MKNNQKSLIVVLRQEEINKIQAKIDMNKKNYNK